jgi:predicted nucleotidyltransferase
VAYKENKRVIDKKIEEYIKLLQKNGFNIWRLYLFGSYATRRFDSESDIDLAIFLDKDEIDGFEEDVRLMHLRRKVDLRIEPHSFARTDFDKTNPFVKEIVTTGKRII